MTQATAHPCPICRKPLHVFPISRQQPDVLSAHCQSSWCPLWMVTLPLGEHEQLTNEQIAGYGRARLKSRAYTP